MSKYKEKEEKNPEEISPKSLLEQLLKEGARKMLQEAIENEVEEYIIKNQSKRDERGHRLAVRNGSLPERCWVHKTANILDKLPKSMQSKAKSLIHDMYEAESKEEALKAYKHFIYVYEKQNFPKRCNV